MNVAELREQLAELPGHLTVFVQVLAEGEGFGDGFDYLYTLDAQPSNLHGSAVVIRVNYEPR